MRSEELITLAHFFKGPRNSIAYYGSGDMDELLEDMYTSKSEDHSNSEYEEDDIESILQIRN